MCVLIFKPADKKLDEALLRNSWKYNYDGGGIAYIDYELGSLVVKKGFDKVDEFIELVMTECTGRDAIIHFRRASPGMVVNAANCHPFTINTHPDGELKKPDTKFKHQYAVAHNGRLPVADTLKYSDTSCFVYQYLYPAFSANPDLLKQGWFAEMIDEMANFRLLENKLVIMKYDRELNKAYVKIIGEMRGKWHKGIWYSNDEPWKKEPKVVASEWYGKGTYSKMVNDHHADVHTGAFVLPQIPDVYCYGSFWMPRELKKGYDEVDSCGWWFNFKSTPPRWENMHTKETCENLPQRPHPEEAALGYRNAVYAAAKKKYDEGVKAEAEKKQKEAEEREKNKSSGEVKGKGGPDLNENPKNIQHLDSNERKLLCKLADNYAAKSKWKTPDISKYTQLDKIMWLRQECRVFIDGTRDLDWLDLDCWMVVEAKKGMLEHDLVIANAEDHDKTIKEENERLLAESAQQDINLPLGMYP